MIQCRWSVELTASNPVAMIAMTMVENKATSNRPELSRRKVTGIRYFQEDVLEATMTNAKSVDEGASLAPRATEISEKASSSWQMLPEFWVER